MSQYSFFGVLFIVTSLQTLNAQSLRDYERAGDQAFERQDYGAAVQHYRDVLYRRDDDPTLLWKYGESARLYNSYLEAELSYKKIADNQKYANKHPLVDFRLAEVAQSQGDYQTAIAYFEKFLREKPQAEASYFESARTGIKNCRKAQIISATPLNVSIEHLGKEINSPYYELAPSIVGDTLFFSSNRFVHQGKDGKKKLSKVMFSKKGSKPQFPGKGFPSTDTAHIAHTTFSPDGHYAVFSVCKDVSMTEKRCDLWLTVMNNRRAWLHAVKLPEPVNLPGVNTTQPNIGYDESLQGLKLWFSSDRTGGAGKMDIWSVPLDTNFFCPCMIPMQGVKTISRLPKFAEPTNLASINSPGNELTPFFHSPTQKLYFSADELAGLGGYDLYFSSQENEQYTFPENVGAGINTSYNDLYMVLKPDGLSGYLSSNRPGSFYLDEKNKACCNDIFHFVLESPIPQMPVLSQSMECSDLLPPTEELPLEPQMATKSPDSPEAVAPLPIIEKPLPNLSEFKGLSLYFDNDEPEKRTRKTTTSLTYQATFENYLNQLPIYKNQLSDKLATEKSAAALSSVEDFFETQVKKGGQQLQLLADNLLLLLKNGKQIDLTVKGFASPRATSDYNFNLAKRRVDCLINEFEHYSEGALLPFIQDGQLKIFELPVGETNGQNAVNDFLNDPVGSIYHPKAAQERRVEIVDLIVH